MACLKQYCLALIYFSCMLTCSWASAAICNATIQGLASNTGNQSPNSKGTINIDCDSIASYTFALSEDTETFLETKRTSGTHHMSYKISTDAARSIILEDGRVSGDPSTMPKHILNQCIPIRQSELPDKEKPTITVMISF